MESNLTQERREAHRMIDALPQEKLHAVRTLLDSLVEPLSKSLEMAPLDDEELNSDTIASIERARISLERGEGIPHDEIRREFGL